MIDRATLRRLATWPRRWPIRLPGAFTAAVTALGAGQVSTGTSGLPLPGRRVWLSVPLVTAVAAGLMAVLLSIDIVGEIEPTSRPAAVDTTSVAEPLPPLVGAPSAWPQAQLASGPDDVLEVELALAAMPEPAAGPKDAAAVDGTVGEGRAVASESATAGARRLPVVPEVPAELDDIARELQRRRAEVLELEAGLAIREAALRAAEADLLAQIDRLDAFQRQLQALVGEAEAEEEERLQQLVKMYETMRAKSAAAIFNRLELPVILSVAKRMREARMAAILAAMDPERARIVTSELARERELPRLD